MRIRRAKNSGIALILGVAFLLASCTSGSQSSERLLQQLDENGADCISYAADVRELFGLDFFEAEQAGAGPTPAVVAECSFESEWFGEREYLVVIAESQSELRALYNHVCEDFPEENLGELDRGSPFLAGENWVLQGAHRDPERLVIEQFQKILGSGEIVTDICS